MLRPEHDRYVDAASKILLRLSETAPAGRPWALKDPRLVMTLGYWTAAAAQVGVRYALLLTMREPLANAASLCVHGVGRRTDPLRRWADVNRLLLEQEKEHAAAAAVDEGATSLVVISEQEREHAASVDADGGTTSLVVSINDLWSNATRPLLLETILAWGARAQLRLENDRGTFEAFDAAFGLTPHATEAAAREVGDARTLGAGCRPSLLRLQPEDVEIARRLRGRACDAIHERSSGTKVSPAKRCLTL